MALVKCKECGGEVSSEATACQKCGAKPPKGTSTATIVIGGVFALIVGSCVFNETNRAETQATKTPEQIAAQAKKEQQFQAVVAGAKWLKKSMKNPTSFELTSAIMMGDEAICYEYRATNSFNAVVPGHRVIAGAVNSDKDKDWNKYCGGKTGTDFTYARRAL